MTLRPVPTTEDVDVIRSVADPVLRNLRITQCYSDLAAALAERTGPGANWAAFATWASRQAGHTIRREDFERATGTMLDGITGTAQADNLRKVLRTLGAAADIASLRSALGHAFGIDAALDRASRAVARGNVKVFEEIGSHIARFLQSLPAGDRDDAFIGEFGAAFQHGDPPDGQDYLQRAFAHYYRALYETDAALRAQLLLLANVEIGYHEQIRLQPDIEAGVDAALDDPTIVKRRLLDHVASRHAWYARLRSFLGRVFARRSPLDLAIEDVHRIVRGRLRAFITDRIMTLELSRGMRLELGDDLPGEFPAELRVIANVELAALLKKIDPTADSLAETGATDWTEFAERIHFIADLFRRYHSTAVLFDAPFSDDQASALDSNRIPPGIQS